MRRKLDQVTGTRRWKATVTDPDEPTAKRASFEITFVTEVQPVPTTTAVPVSGPPRNEVHHGSGTEGGVLAAEKSVRAWE